MTGLPPGLEYAALECRPLLRMCGAASFQSRNYSFANSQNILSHSGRVLRPGDLVKKITGSRKYPSFTRNKLPGFRTETYSGHFLGAVANWREEGDCFPMMCWA